MRKGRQLGSILLFAWVALLFSGSPLVAGPLIKMPEFKTTVPTTVDSAKIKVEVLVPGSYFHGIQGITFDPDDNLYGCSIIGQETLKVELGPKGPVRISPFTFAPEGIADDLEFSPGGQLYWTGLYAGHVYTKLPSGEVKSVAEKLPGVNGIAFDAKGRLFVSECMGGRDAVWELDPNGMKAPRLVVEKIGGLNGFDFGPDGNLYGPLYVKGMSIVKIDVDTGAVKTVAEGFVKPCAANFDSKGNLFVADLATGEVFRVDVKTGAKKVVSKVYPSLNNLAINKKDEVFVNVGSRNGIYHINTETGTVTPYYESQLPLPGGMGIRGNKIYTANVFSVREVNILTGKSDVLAYEYAQGVGLNLPFACTPDGDDRLLLSSWMTDVIQEFDLKTKRVVKTFRAKGPNSVLRAADGSILVAELKTGSLVRISGDQGEQRKEIIKDLKAPMDLALASTNKVYLTEALGGTLDRIDLVTGQKEVIVSGLEMPEGICVQTDGKVLLVEVGKKRLIEIDPQTGKITPLVTNLPVGFKFHPIFPATGLMSDVVVSAEGDIFVASDMENAMFRFKRK